MSTVVKVVLVVAVMIGWAILVWQKRANERRRGLQGQHDEGDAPSPDRT